MCPHIKLKDWNEYKTMIKLHPTEVAEITKQGKHLNLSKTQKSRSGKKRKYYLCNDDLDAMRIVARMRGYDLNTFYHECVEGLNYV